jgi:hypothetical protein
MRTTRRPPAQRRSDAAPLALVLAGWALAVAPVAHPLLAHGVPFLRLAADERWVQHDGAGHPEQVPPRRASHSHAPGAPEHLQISVLAAAASPALEAVLLALPAPPARAGLAVALPRRWSQEQPQAP